MDHQRFSGRRGSSYERRPSMRQTSYERERSSDRRSSTARRRSSARRRLSDMRASFDRRRSSFRRPSFRRPSIRRPSFRRPSVRRPSVRRPSVKWSSIRRPSAKWSSIRRPSAKWSSIRRPSVKKKLSFKSATYFPPDEEETSSTDSDDYYSWDTDEDTSSDMSGSEHTLSATVKTNIQMGEQGLGLILIQNGPYIQISSLVEKSAAVRDGKLQPGDILIKIGHANVLGWTLRELRQLLHTTLIGTVLQIQVYREFMKLPVRWETAIDSIPERKGAKLGETSTYTSEEAWSSSEDSEDYDCGCHVSDDEELIGGSHVVSFGSDEIYTTTEVTEVPVNRTVHADAFPNVKAVPSLSFETSKQPKWISKDWHIFERKTYTFTVGSDIGNDIIIHKDFEDESDADISSLYLTSSSPYWTMLKGVAPPSLSSSSSTVSDAFWLENFSQEVE
ncbi:domain-containing 9 [Podarcis lilfordi]|uniref:Domain-containing 9 n=2 Tax=Podarcis lilfordi TaxID=74358 RepID=A0AA35PKA5_9SAUR|nr:domain-containing 9 [Podarcis lilfordi]